jgi:hypothetical protein
MFERQRPEDVDGLPWFIRHFWPRGKDNGDPVVALWHEFGHASAVFHGGVIPSDPKKTKDRSTDVSAVEFENRMRVWLFGPCGPGNARKIRHGNEPEDRLLVTAPCVVGGTSYPPR